MNKTETRMDEVGALILGVLLIVLVILRVAM